MTDWQIPASSYLAHYCEESTQHKWVKAACGYKLNPAYAKPPKDSTRKCVICRRAIGDSDD